VGDNKFQHVSVIVITHILCITAVTVCLLLEMYIMRINVCLYHKQEWRQMKGYTWDLSMVTGWSSPHLLLMPCKYIIICCHIWLWYHGVLSKFNANHWSCNRLLSQCLAWCILWNGINITEEGLKNCMKPYLCNLRIIYPHKAKLLKSAVVINS
jgi:hypothetical protein